MVGGSTAGTFWTGARGNLSTGGGSAFGDAGIASAEAKFGALAGPDGNIIGINADRMLVPPALEAAALKFYVSTQMRDTTGNVVYPTGNVYSSRFRPIVVPELGSASFAGSSQTAWWLLANPAAIASAVMCFLNGKEEPTIESAEADFNTLGVQFRGVHDFGVAMAEYLGSVKSAGA
jgi:hypothetical protein